MVMVGTEHGCSRCEQYVRAWDNQGEICTCVEDMRTWHDQDKICTCGEDVAVEEESRGENREWRG